MSIPTPHAPDEEWAEERVRRLMEPDEPVAVPAPGESVSANGQVVDAIASAPAVDTAADPASDDDVDKLLKEIAPVPETQPASDVPTEPAAETATEPVPDKPPADPATDKAVDEIMKTDGDEALEAQDVAAQKDVVMKPNLWERLKNDWSDWWDDPRKRYGTIAVFVVLLGVLFSFPASRAWALNLVGVRSTVTVSVLDGTTNLPLKNATVSIAGETGTSDSAGKANVQHVKLGNQQLTVSKQAFATTKEVVHITSGSHTLPPVALKAVGTQFTFTVTDYLSTKPIAGAEVSSGQATAQTDKNGKAVLTVKPSDNTQLKVQFSASHYRTDTLTINTTVKTPTAFTMVGSAKAVFVSKQSGKYDLYSSDLDGKNRKVILAASGYETANSALSVSPDGTEAALVSVRDTQHDAQGYQLSSLTVVDTANGTSQTVEHADEIDMLGWSGTHLIYQQTVAGASAANVNRQKIISYDASTNKKLQLASANYFNGTAVIGNGVYYAVSSTDPGTTANFVKINVDATGKQILANQEVWTVLRTSYDTLLMQGANNTWLSYTVGAVAPKTASAPDDYDYVQYVDNTAGSSSLWVDNRDGKGVLLNHDVKSAKDTVVTTQAGLGTPVYWLDSNTAVYRKQTPQETADYAVSLLGGQPKKIADVTATTGYVQVR